MRKAFLEFLMVAVAVVGVYNVLYVDGPARKVLAVATVVVIIVLFVMRGIAGVRAAR